MPVSTHECIEALELSYAVRLKACVYSPAATLDTSRSESCAHAGKLLGVAVTADQQLQGYGFVTFDTLQDGSTVMYVGADNKSSEYGLLSAFNFPTTKGGGVRDL